MRMKHESFLFQTMPLNHKEEKCDIFMLSLNLIVNYIQPILL